MDNLLALLKRIEWHTIYRYGDAETECPECEGDKYQGHEPGCELKTIIDKLEEVHAKKLNNDIEDALKQFGFRKVSE